jgi:hypothetical protein
MSAMKPIPILGICVLMIVIVRPSSGAEDNVKPSVPKDYPEALSRIEAYYSQVRGSAKLSIVDSLPDNKEVKRILHFSANRRLKKIWEYRPGKIGDKVGREVEGISCVGEDYSFRIERDRDGSSPVIRNVGSEAQLGVETTIKSVLWDLLSTPYSVLGVPIREIMSAPAFSITSIDHIEKQGRQLLKIAFTFESQNKPPEKPYPIKSGWIVVSPNENWVLREYECTFRVGKQGSGHATGAVEYRGDQVSPGVLSLPKQVVVSSIAPSGRETRRTLEFDEIESAIVDKHEFTLTSYGLPEIAPKKPGVGRFILINVTCIGLLVLAVTLKRFSQRGTKYPRSAPPSEGPRAVPSDA